MTRDFSKRVGYVSPVFEVAPAEAMKVNPATGTASKAIRQSDRPYGLPGAKRD